MRYTFKPDDCMVITIPLGSIRNASEGQLMPNKFTCRFKDTYKVFQRGRPKALGAAQIITSVFILCLGAILMSWHFRFRLFGIEMGLVYMVPSILYIVCGILAIAAGQTPLMPMMKASFIFNIIGLCVAVVVPLIGLIITINSCHFGYYNYNHYQHSPEPVIQDRNVCVGLNVVTAVLYAFEFLLSAILIHWESKAVCRAHFNSLPMISLKQDM